MNEFEIAIERVSQRYVSGGVNTAPEIRLMLCCIAKALRASEVVETGYDAGYTTLALSMSGAHIVSVDNLQEYRDAEQQAKSLLSDIPNIELRNTEALTFLRSLPINSVDLAFVDDMHQDGHVKLEAMELWRILKPGGIGAFHDVKHFGFLPTLRDVFQGWEYIVLPALSPGWAKAPGVDYGIGLFKKPEE